MSRRSQRFRPFSSEESRRDVDRIMGAPAEPAARILLGPAEAKAPVPTRLQSKYHWNPFSLFSGLAAAVLPLLSPPAWKILTAVAIRQLHLGLPGENAATPVAISLDDFCVATHLSRMTVIKAIREVIQADWLAQEKRRTPHCSLYSINWKRVERAERERRKKDSYGNRR
jgi:hypothetical protein